ncbi:cellulase family glycosylhydrolase [Microbacterium sp. CGR1]|uniref:cellulase family glycosylhydrolase n=1 Tax=Microbacterium sp. CGR1 TaxID=1696072 RepID=UPI0009E197EB|nr:cellulase family glycosylhydrolase [Microbacterium sp. CGR1]
MRRNAAKLPTPDGVDALIGVNYWSRTGGPLMWRDYDGDVVAEELEQLRAHGITHTRSFLYWPDFHPQPDQLSEEMLGHFADFLQRHIDAGMWTIPTFIVGHMSAQNWDPAWRNGRDIFTDVWFVGRQAWYIREVVSRFADNAAIDGWLLTNEVPIYADWRSRGIDTIDAEAVTAWAQILIDAVRAGGGKQAVSIGEGAWGVEITGNDNGFRVRELEPLIDFFGPHVYRMEDDLVRQHLGAAFICELLDIGDKPVVMEEFGVTSDYVDDANAAHYYRQVLHHTLLAGATAWIPWNNVDYDAFADREPYSHHPFEMHFGLVTSEGEPKAQLLEVKEFASRLAELDFGGLERPDTRVGLLVSSFLESPYAFTAREDGPTVFQVARQSYVAAREADLPIGVIRERDGLPDNLDLIIVPSTKALLAPTWTDLVRRAEAGAVVYASYFNGVHANQRGSWWPKLDELFGVRKSLKYGLIEPVLTDTVTLEFRSDFGRIKAGERLTFAVGGTVEGRSHLPVDATEAEVIAVDGYGQPALLRRRIGSGSMILSTYPLEYFASAVPRVNPEPTWLLYQALALEAKAAPGIRVDDPRVMTGVMEHRDGRRFVWFISQSEQPVTFTPVTNARLSRIDNGAATTHLSLPPFGVEILAVTPEEIGSNGERGSSSESRGVTR